MPLRAGYSANADIVVKEKTDTLLIPERLVAFNDGAASVEVPAGPGLECSIPSTGENPKRWSDWQPSTGCVFEMYVVGDCGTEMHVPFFDVEGMKIQVSNGITGEPILINAENQCHRGSFDYCNGCVADRIAPWGYFEAQFGVDCPSSTPLACKPYYKTDEATTTQAR